MNGGSEQAFFAPRLPEPGEVLDIDPPENWAGYNVVHVADLELADGVLLESSGESLGSDGIPVDLGTPGTHPYYLLMSRVVGRAGRPALAQLVIEPDTPPVRWEDDDRFGFGTDAGMGYVGSPRAVPLPLEERFDENLMWWFFQDAALDPCFQYRNDEGANFVLFENGYGDGFFPGAAGYGPDGQLVAITWFFGWESWVLAGIPGDLPAPVEELIDCRQRLVDEGIPYADTAWCPDPPT